MSLHVILLIYYCIGGFPRSNRRPTISADRVGTYHLAAFYFCEVLPTRLRHISMELLILESLAMLYILLFKIVKYFKSRRQRV